MSRKWTVGDESYTLKTDMGDLQVAKTVLPESASVNVEQFFLFNDAFEVELNGDAVISIKAIEEIV